MRQRYASVCSSFCDLYPLLTHQVGCFGAHCAWRLRVRIAVLAAAAEASCRLAAVAAEDVHTLWTDSTCRPDFAARSFHTFFHFGPQTGSLLAGCALFQLLSQSGPHPHVVLICMSDCIVLLSILLLA